LKAPSSVAPSAAKPSKLKPSGVKPSAAPPPFAVTVSDRSATCTTASNTYKLHVEITTSIGFSSARLYWIEGSWPRHSLPITATGPRSGEVTKVLLKDRTEWWVQAQSADGRTALTQRAHVSSPCL
jgi:hypothetical protein